MRERGERPVDQKPPSGAPEKPKFAPPINWWKLDERERAETLDALGMFVRELVRRYGLTEQVIPRCWYLHEAVIQELLALFQYRNQQQFLPVAPPSAPLDFHYQFQLVVGRLRGWVTETGCNGPEHSPTRIPGWADEQSVGAAEWDTDFDEYLTASFGYERSTEGG